MEVVLVYKTLRCVFFSVSFYQFAVDFFHFLYFIIMFDSICFYAHQIGLRAGFNSTQYGLILHPFYGRFVLHSTTTKNRHSGLLMAIWIKLICIKKIMIEISVFQIIIQMHVEYWNATTNDCKILDRDRQFI